MQLPKSKMFVAILVVVFVAITVVGIFGLGTSNSTNGKYDDFAKCLTEKNVVMYGAYWCPHCQNQKQMFGKSWNYINYVECSLPNRGGQNAVCNAAGINGYPTWKFSNEQVVEGELTIEQLREYSSCSLKQGE